MQGGGMFLFIYSRITDLGIDEVQVWRDGIRMYFFFEMLLFCEGYKMRGIQVSFDKRKCVVNQFEFFKVKRFFEDVGEY